MSAAEPIARFVATVGAIVVLAGGCNACSSPSPAPDQSLAAATETPTDPVDDGAPPPEPLASSPEPPATDDSATMVVVDEDFNPIGTADQLQAKIEIYSRCFQVLDAPLRGLWFSYLSIVDRRWGYARSKWYGFGAVKTAAIEPCMAELDKVTEIEPALEEIDELAVAYRDTAAVVLPLVEEARDYFGDKSYLKDRFKGAKAMHAPLKQAFSDWLSASNDLRKLVNPAIASVFDVYTTELASETKRGVPYFVERAAFQCMVVMDVLALPGADPDKASAAIESLRTANKDLTKKIKSDAEANTAYLPVVTAFTKVVTAAIKVRMALDIRGFSKYYTAMYYRMLVVAYGSAMGSYAESAATWRDAEE
jgi:hypothetical protein